MSHNVAHATVRGCVDVCVCTDVCLVCVCVCVTDAEHVSVSMGMLANHRFHSQSVDQVSVGQKQPKRPYRVDVVAVQNTEDVICKSREWSVCVCVCACSD